ncbi:MAG: hypothetical protein JW954_03270 [Dehalococcoidaceae bacterium]|nr:hypothetical protein [Dehalococcoidaceae bacterium]
MDYNWQEDLRTLEGYVKTRPAIKIESASVTIPSDVRDEFYVCFDRVRENFIRQYFSRELALAEELKFEFFKAETKAVAALGLHGQTKIAAPLRWLVNDPLNGMMRPVFNPLFDLLKEKITPEDFEQTGRLDIQSYFNRYYNLGYERWMVFSLLKWLEPSEALAMPVHDCNLYSSSMEGDSQYERSEVPPSLEPLSEMIFDHSTHVTFTVPELIVYSLKLKKYVALKTGFVEPNWKARILSDERQWLDLKPMVQVFTALNPWPNVMLYIGDHPDDIRVVADKYRLCRPDIILDTLTGKEQPDSAVINRIKDHHRLIKPVSGGGVVCRTRVDLDSLTDAGDSEETGALTPAVKSVDAGYDYARLAEAFEELMPVSAGN